MRRTVPLGVGALALVITGCAAIRTPSPVLCGLVGAAGGAGAGAGIGGANSDNGEGRNRGKGAAIGVFAGAVVGYALCSLLEKAEAPAPAPPTRPPPPPPPPPQVEPTPPPPPQVKRRIVLRGVNFDFNNDEIRGDAAVILDEAARLLNEDPETRVRIEGHTDWIGSEDYNQTLSERRAESVRSYLVEHGVTAERITTAGYGESRPIATNETREGRALNRRVELKVLGP